VDSVSPYCLLLTATALRLLLTAHPTAHFFLLTAHCSLLTLYAIFLSQCRGGEMADATDLKSVDRKVVWVRLPPSAPISSITYKYSSFESEFSRRFHPTFDSINQLEKHALRALVQLVGLTPNSFTGHLGFDDWDFTHER
jgi:hypothetical protein